MKKNSLLLGLALIGQLLFSQAPPGYYDPANGLSGEELQEALHNIIKDHDAITYSNVWSAFEDTDKKSNGKVWDIYSDIPGGTPPYQFTFYSDQCGNYSAEGDCYNREHSFPRSWFGGDVYPMYSDLFHVYPTDGYVNGKRGNYPYGEVNNTSWTSLNGCKLGDNGYPGYSGTVFEPIDAYKGDLARTYFYMATRYLGEDNGWPGSPMVDGSQPKEWALNMLYDWHLDDPVNQKEGERNNAVYDIQENRNPFIDHPEYVGAIWFNTSVTDDALLERLNFSVFPNPVVDEILIRVALEAQTSELAVTISDETGRQIYSAEYSSRDEIRIDAGGFSKGFYFLSITRSSKNLPVIYKLIK
jgi:endonuclease I